MSTKSPNIIEDSWTIQPKEGMEYHLVIGKEHKGLITEVHSTKASRDTMQVMNNLFIFLFSSMISI